MKIVYRLINIAKTSGLYYVATVQAKLLEKDLVTSDQYGYYFDTADEAVQDGRNKSIKGFYKIKILPLVRRVEVDLSWDLEVLEFIKKHNSEMFDDIE